MPIRRLIDDLSRLDGERASLLRQLSGDPSSLAELDRQSVRDEVHSLNRQIRSKAEEVIRDLRDLADGGRSVDPVRVGAIQDRELRAFLSRVEDAVETIEKVTPADDGTAADGAAEARSKLEGEERRARELREESTTRVEDLEEEDRRLAEQLEKARDDRERGRRDRDRIESERKRLRRDREKASERRKQLEKWESERRKERRDLVERRDEAAERLGSDDLDAGVRRDAEQVKRRAEEGIRRIDRQLEEGLGFQREELERVGGQIDEEDESLGEALETLEERLAEIDEFIERASGRREEIREAIRTARRQQREIDGATEEIARGLRSLEA